MCYSNHASNEYHFGEEYSVAINIYRIISNAAAVSSSDIVSNKGACSRGIEQIQAQSLIMMQVYIGEDLNCDVTHNIECN